MNYFRNKKNFNAVEPENNNDAYCDSISVIVTKITAFKKLSENLVFNKKLIGDETHQRTSNKYF